MVTETLSRNEAAAGQATQNMLNRQIAGWTVLYEKLHHCHWYVKGPHFYTLHGKFEQLYNEAAAHIDALAERLLAIGGKPVSTLKDAVELTDIPEAAGNETAEQMVAAIAQDFTAMAGELKKGMELAETEGDAATADLLLSIQSGLEQHVWMLRSLLG